MTGSIERAILVIDAALEPVPVPETSVTGFGWLVVVEAIEEVVPATGIASPSEDESVAKEIVLVTTLPLDLVNSPKVSEMVEPRELTIV